MTVVYKEKYSLQVYDPGRATFSRSVITKFAEQGRPVIPLPANRDRTAFKLYAPDVGLLYAMSNLDVRTVLQGKKLFVEFKGTLTEQFVIQQLISHSGINPFYWSANKSGGKVDFVMQIDELVLPLEVKATENLQTKKFKVS